jgi:PhzF family phenazine biosynthesis protein
MFHEIFTVDSFSHQPFRGNPAGVCVLREPMDEITQRMIARELNLSETAFLQDHGDHYKLRWFTPEVEIDLCGHATLASAHVIWQEGLRPTSEQLRFRTRSGLLTATKNGEWIELDFPAYQVEPVADMTPIAAAIGAPVLSAWLSSSQKVLAELESSAQVKSLRPDFSAIAQAAPHGLIVTAQSEPPFDFVSRFFAPAYGINEDPVTGSAHCVLVPYWSQKLGKKELYAFQASARGGELKLRLEGDRVKIGGQATTIMKANMRIA